MITVVGIGPGAADHILPLAAGGVHENANVQLAHFICNSRKRELPANDQLRLVG